MSDVSTELLIERLQRYIADKRLSGEDGPGEFVDTAARIITFGDICAIADRLILYREARDQVEKIISAWAFAHNIDGAARNDLFDRLRRAALGRT